MHNKPLRVWASRRVTGFLLILSLKPLKFLKVMQIEDITLPLILQILARFFTSTIIDNKNGIQRGYRSCTMTHIIFKSIVGTVNLGHISTNNTFKYYMCILIPELN